MYDRDHNRGPIPDGYSAVPIDALPRIDGGIRLSSNILVNETGCWHIRWRNSDKSSSGRGYVWAQDIDSRAPRRYRNRVWLCAAEMKIPEGCMVGTSCGDDNCISPDHLTIAPCPVAVSGTGEGGRWGWIGERQHERYGWIPDAKLPNAEKKSAVDRKTPP